MSITTAISSVLSDRSWQRLPEEEQLAEISKRLQAAGLQPGTSDFDSAFFSVAEAASSESAPLKEWMAENFTQEMGQEIGVDVAAMTGFSPDSSGYYNSAGEFVKPDDPYQRDTGGTLKLVDGEPIRADVYAVTEFYKSVYGRQPTEEEIADGIAGLNTPQGYRRFFINQYGREPTAEEIAYGIDTSKSAIQGMNAAGGTGATATGATGNKSLTNPYKPGTPEYESWNERKSAYDLLFEQFNQYGMGGLVEPLKNLITEGISPSEFTLRLRDTDAYKKRFAANAQRIQKGLRALSEAEYIGLEDQYQDVMRRYGLPESYYARGDMGRQEGFEKFIGGDVSPVELEDRIQTAQNRVVNAAPEVSKALREFYPDITNGDILAYALDPSKAIENIKRKVTAAEIGAGAIQAGLSTNLRRAEELRSYGVTGDQARQGYQTIGSLLPRASTLGDIYSKQGLGAYTQTTAEAEVFGTPGAIEAEKKRRQLAQLETASFSGSSGAAGGALARDRAGSF